MLSKADARYEIERRSDVPETFAFDTDVVGGARLFVPVVMTPTRGGNKQPKFHTGTNLKVGENKIGLNNAAEAVEGFVGIWHDLVLGFQPQLALGTKSTIDPCERTAIYS